MKKVKTLLKPDVKVVYLNNQSSERVEYLEVPADIDRGSLAEDIKNGATHLKETAELLDKKKASRVIVVSSENREAGLMAIAYMAACLHQPKEEDFLEYDHLPEEEKNPFDEESFAAREEYGTAWKESGRKIPVIDAGEIKQFLYRNNESFEMGMFRVQQRNAMNTGKPYWTECRKEPVCIVCDKFQADELNETALNLFRTNRRVFLLYLNSVGSDFVAPFYTFEIDSKMFDKMKNHITLLYAADEVGVFLDKVDRNKYYTHILKQNMWERKLKVSRDFTYVRIINLAASLRKDAVCATLDLIVNYALKDMEVTEGVVLGNKDFDFVDRFLRQEHKVEKERAESRLYQELVGMEQVKEQVMDTVNVMKYNRLRANLNIEGSKFHNVHVMLGAPGTAKTTVAKLMGQIMMEEKLLPNARFVCVNGAELKGEYVGQSAPKTKALFQHYDVIIIDEAYSLTQGSGTGALDSFSQEAIAQLIVELEKHSMDKLIIFAGYGGKDMDSRDNKMQAFLEANPGIKSRITSTFYFESYKPDELVEIFKRMAKLANYSLDAGVEEPLEQFFSHRVLDREFGNGREARNLLETSIVFAAKRLMADKKETYTAEELKQLTCQDVQKAIAKMEQSLVIRETGKNREIGFTGGWKNESNHKQQSSEWKYSTGI